MRISQANVRLLARRNDAPIFTLVSASGSRRYRRNLGNTILTVLLTIPLITVLYCLVWYPAMRKTVLEHSEDTVVSISGFLGITCSSVDLTS